MGHQDIINKRAKIANAVQNWDQIWASEGLTSWRGTALKEVYTYISDHIDSGSTVTDIAGGVGILCSKLVEDKQVVATVAEHSQAALDIASKNGLNTLLIDLNSDYTLPEQDYYTATEVAEHLTNDTRTRLFAELAKKSKKGVFISVPNHILPPEQEPQHTIMYTALQFKNELKKHFQDVYVACRDRYLIGVCGPIAHKNFTLSVTFPACNESADIEKTLRSFMEVADEIVIGVDKRGTDNTFEIASWYADATFWLENPEGVGEEYQGEGKVHFSHIRNQCIDRCSSEWLFMTEAHEYLLKGVETLRHLDKHMPKESKIGFVNRRGGSNQWAFPWLIKNLPEIRFTRPVHNIVDYPAGTYCVKLTQVVTLHERSIDRSKERAEQRKVQNRTTLLNDWLSRGSEASLFYVAQEWRGLNIDKSIERYEQFLTVSNNGTQKYQCRLALAQAYMDKLGETGDKNWHKKAKDILFGCVADDWSRADHWLWLGDIFYLKEEYEAAYRFYSYATLTIGEPPFSLWWTNIEYYSYLPCQRMATVCADLDRVEEALVWSKKVLEQLPPDAPDALVEETKNNIKLIEEHIEKHGNGESAPIEKKEFGVPEEGEKEDVNS